MRTDAGVLVERASCVPRQPDERGAHRLVVLEERADGLLDRELIDGGLGGLERQADAGADNGGGTGGTREERARGDTPRGSEASRNCRGAIGEAAAVPQSPHTRKCAHRHERRA